MKRHALVATALLLAAGLSSWTCGCGPAAPSADITQYFGKTKDEVKGVLGEPDAAAQLPGFSMGDRKYTRDQCPRLPKVFVELRLFFSDAGYCYSVGGVTERYETPEALLAAVGLGAVEMEATGRDALGLSYVAPPYDIVQVHRPSSAVQQYDSFIATNSAAGAGPTK